jgi:ribosomal protein S6--L-glutamate ligase
MEVNSSPGFEGLEAASGVDIATLYVEHAVEFGRAHATGWQKARLI